MERRENENVETGGENSCNRYNFADGFRYADGNTRAS
jgi:hypothetical protein